MLGSRLFSLRSFVVAMKPAVKKTAEVGCLVRSVGMVRSLSGSVPSKCASVQRDLISALQEEINEEKKREEAMEPIWKWSVTGFDVSTKGTKVRLHKKHGNNESIHVFFNVNHSMNVDYEDEAADDEVAEDEVSENMQMPESFPQLSVQVTKGDQRLCFELEIVTTDGFYNFEVRKFYLAPADKSGKQDVEADVYAASGEFADQAIKELLFCDYLVERGIDGDFCDMIFEFVTYYERLQYIDLLDKVKNFI